MADVQIYVNMTQQPINVIMDDIIPISVSLENAAPVNVVFENANPLNFDITGQIKGDTGPPGEGGGSVVYTSRLDTRFDPILYAGEALPGSSENNSVWRIWRVDVSVGSIKEWANGVATFINQWTERLNLSYS